MAVSDYSATPGSNTSISGINIAEGCSPANLNNAIRQLMADIAAYDDTEIAALAPKASPALTGTPTAPTATAGTSTTQIATTAFVQTAATARALPIGSIIMHAGSTAPLGYFACDGGAVSRITYPLLFAAIGTTHGAGNGTTTFNLPDLRGEFVRGWDNGRGVDSGRAFASAQSPQIGEHSHTFSRPINGGSGQPGGTGGSLTVQNTSATGGTENASETRPRNIALLFCIKID
jgi:hypothetical protein